MGSQQASILVPTPFRGIVAPHYVLSLSIAISLSGGRKDSLPMMRRNDGLYGFEFVSWIATDINFGGGQVGVA